MGIASSRSYSVTEGPRYAPLAAAPRPPPRLNVSNRALPAPPGTAQPSRPAGRLRRLATAAPDSGLHNGMLQSSGPHNSVLHNIVERGCATRASLPTVFAEVLAKHARRVDAASAAAPDNVMQNVLRACITEASLQPVFAKVLAEHARRVDAASAAAPGQTETGRAEARRDVRLQDVYTPEQIQASRDLRQQAFDLAWGECQPATEIRGRTPQTDSPAAAVRTAGYLLMDPALPAPLRARLVGATQAFARACEGGTESSSKTLDALTKAIAEVARQAHWGEGGYGGLQRVLLDRMMPRLLETIQRQYPGTDLRTAVTQLPRFFNVVCLELWQMWVTWPVQRTRILLCGDLAYTEQAEQVEEMALHFVMLPELLNQDAEAVIERCEAHGVSSIWRGFVAPLRGIAKQDAAPANPLIDSEQN